MTRINVGIRPEELCDQHLIAEYREILRAINHPPKGKPPEQFKLGTGHVTWCAIYSGSLCKRHMRLCIEMKYRGFKVNCIIKDAIIRAFNGKEWSNDDVYSARPIVIDRINERLNSMKRVPTWTKRNKPKWVKETNHA